MGILEKLRGSTKGPPRVSSSEILWSWIGAFLGIGLLGWLAAAELAQEERFMLIGSFGASAVLLYGAPKSPLAQPRNVLGGHILSAFVGVASYKLLAQEPWLASAIAVSTAIALMYITRTLHPPGGATALIAVIGGDKVHGLGFSYALAPVGVGASLMILVALLVNNLPRQRRYPEFWF